ncbi:MAG: tetratricopeptide repeat protein [Planctomycetes bacterium]|nr:tetratricopeptide repeat protein [Planctomycetota bacterium]
MGADFALIPFASRVDDDQSARIAQGLSLELADWLRGDDLTVPMLTSAQTDEDGAWRKLVNFQDELTPSAVAEIVEMVRGENGADGDGLDDEEETEVDNLKLMVSGVLDVDLAPAETGQVLRVHGDVTVTNVAGAFAAARLAFNLTPPTFRPNVQKLFREIAEALGHKPRADYDTGTSSFQAWLNLLITRALKLAAELGAVDRDEGDLYLPALQAAKLDPAFTPARDRLGELAQVLVLERGFEPLPAADALDEIMQRVGSDWKSERVRGQLLLLADKPDLAAKSFCLLIKGKLEAPTQQERMHAALMAGKAFNQANRYGEAQRVLSLAMQAEDLKVDAIVEAGSSSAALGEARVAERLWLRALELEKHFVPARLHLAHLYRREGETQKAAQQYEELLKAPELPRELFADAAEFFVVNRMHETACATAERYANEYPGDAIAHVLLASSLNALGRHHRALKALDQAELCVGVNQLEAHIVRQRRFAKHPESEAEFRRLADHALTGEAAEAERGLAALVKSYPDFWEAHYFLGVSLRRQEKWDDARRKFEEVRDAIELPGIDKELTKIWSALGQPEKALECAERAMDAAPEDPTAMTNYAAALTENGRLEEALKYAQRAGAIMPDDPVNQRLLDLLEARFRKRSFLTNMKSVLKEAGSWFKLLRRKKK